MLDRGPDLQPAWPRGRAGRIIECVADGGDGGDDEGHAEDGAESEFLLCWDHAFEGES